MKTRIIKIVIFLFLISACTMIINKKKNDLKKMNLNGNVKSIKKISFNAVDKFGEITKGSSGCKSDNKEMDSYSQFNEKGNEIESTSYFFGGVYFVKIHKYDEKENKTETNFYNEHGILRFKVIFKYDEKGNRIEENQYTDENLNFKSTFKYDQNENNIESETYASDGSLIVKYTFKYDQNGKKIESETYNLDGSLNEKYTYQYDEKGNMIEENKYNSDESLNKKYTFKYEFDRKGNWIKKIEFDNINIPKCIVEREIEYW